MKILAIETSCERASVALRIGDELVQRDLDGHATHSERLLATIAGLLADSGLTPGTLDAIAFGAGPGAFTGLRLACGVAQGLAMGAGIGVVPVSSLAALARQAPGPNVLALTDARMGEIYSAAFDVRSGSVRVLHEPECLPPDQFALPGGEGWYLIGSALRAYPDLVSRATGKISGTNADAVPLAAGIAALAATTIAHTGAIAPELAQPIYVRDKVALTTAERLARGGKA